jgi:hypothetical protein
VALAIRRRHAQVAATLALLAIALSGIQCATSTSPPAVTAGQFAGTWFNDDTSSVVEKVVVSNSNGSITADFYDKCVQNPSPIDCETFTAVGAFNGTFVPALYVNPGLTPTQYTEVTMRLEGSKLNVVVITIGSTEPPRTYTYHPHA